MMPQTESQAGVAWLQASAGNASGVIPAFGASATLR